MLATQNTYHHGKQIEDGDLVVGYVSPQVMRGIYVKNDPEFVVQFTSGTYHTQDWIGRRFGTTVYPRKARQGVTPLFLLAPTPELWTRVLQHRTQILYIADISLVCAFLELSPGKTILESGTGSGSLTHALARSIAPTGHIHTFEFHEERCNMATEEFLKHGLSDLVTVEYRDVQMHGFPETFKNKAHGVFLDLPEPWKAVKSAVDCLIPGHTMITFSPCIEQIQRTCKAMEETTELVDIRTMECLAKEYKIKQENLITDLASFATKSTNQDDNNSRKRKETEPLGENHETSSAVLNARTVAGKGHTGFLTVARKFSK